MALTPDPLNVSLPGVSGGQRQPSAPRRAPVAGPDGSMSEGNIDAAIERLRQNMAQGNLDSRAQRGSYLNILV